MRVELSRRQALIGTTAALATTAGCGFLSTEKDDSGGSSAGTSADREAPMLTELVDKGELPPLKDRLPANPSVVRTLEENGGYGGTIRRVFADAASGTGTIRTICRVGLIEFSLESYEPQPGIAESYRVEKGGRRYIFTLRKGIRWSDGEPFTTDDLAFYFEEFLANETLNPVAPVWYLVDGEPGTFTKLDDHTFQLDFTQPHALLPKYLCYSAIGSALFLPRHYLSKYLPGDVAALNSEAKKAGYGTWDLQFAAVNDVWLNPDLPVLSAWRLTEPATGASAHALLERNPYYWKVDSDGRQLPYIDRISYDFMETKTIVLRAAGGQIDLQNQFLSFENASVLVEGADKGNYDVLEWASDASWIALYMSQSHKDPVVRALMQNRDFRAAMSHAINRDEMNQTIFNGLGGIAHPGPIPEDAYSIKGYGMTFTEYDVDKANDLLDSVGLNERDGDGWRLRSDGNRLELQILTFESETGSSTDAYEMVTRYWGEVGVKSTYKVVSAQLWRDRVIAGDVDVPGYTVAGFMWDIDPLWYVPTSDATYWAPLFGLWYASGGADGEEPPPDLRRLQQIYDEMKVTLDEQKRIELGREIIQAHDENVWMIGTTSTPFQPGVKSRDLVNVRPKAVASYRLGHEEVTWFEQVFYRNPGDH